MTDLRVDYEHLSQSKSQLESIKSAFDDLEGSVSDASDDWGDDQISGAMHSFATNWSYHRKKLSSKIDSSKQKIDKTMDSFEKADKDLASKINGAVKVSK